MRYLYSLLIFIPVSFVLELIGASHTWIFVTAAGSLIPLAALLLAGCAIVPVAPYGYVRPRPRVTYVYPAYPYGWYAPRYYRHW